jgi:hypothetical protein
MKLKSWEIGEEWDRDDEIWGGPVEPPKWTPKCDSRKGD